MSLNAQTDHAILVARYGEPDTCLVFRCSSDAPMTQEQVLERVQEASTDWMLETQEGQRAWADSVGDFNIGDLASALDPELCRCLTLHGIFAVSITSPSHNVCPAWHYDTVLADRTRLEASKV